MRRCTRRMRSPVPFFSSPLLALQVLHGGELRPCSPAQGPTGPEPDNLGQLKKQVAVKVPILGILTDNCDFYTAAPPSFDVPAGATAVEPLRGCGGI